MTVIRKLLALFLVLAVAFGCTGTLFAGSYSDLEGKWSQPYMEELAKRKFLSGYSDGTMKPDKDITAAETLVVLSRFYGLSETELSAVYEDYDDAANAVTDITWVRPYVAVAMAAGIITYSEAVALDLNVALTKEQLSVFLVRAMQMEVTAQALEDTELVFEDKDTVDEACKGSVALLSQLGIVSGNTVGQFLPKGNVTRAIVATMVCKILDYLEDEGIALKLSGYSGLSLAEGILTHVSAAGFTIRDYTGVSRYFSRGTVFTATMNGKSVVMDDDYEEAYVNLRLIDGKVTSMVITDPEDGRWEQGTLRAVNVKTTSISVYGLEDNETTGYDISRAKVTIDGEAASVSDLENGYFVSLRDVDDRITEVRACSQIFAVEGTITGISYGSTIILSMDVENDPGVELRLAIYKLPSIKRGAMSVSADKLAVGDLIEAQIAGGEVSAIVVKVNTVTGRGTITSVTSSADSTGWVLTMEDGSAASYTLARNVVAYEGKTTIDFSTLTFGDEVSFVLQDGVISSVTLEKRHESSAAKSGKLNLEVLYVNTKEKTVACMDENQNLIYMVCNTNTTIMNTASGKELSISSLTAGDLLEVWGTYNQTGQLVATIVVVTLKK